MTDAPERLWLATLGEDHAVCIWHKPMAVEYVRADRIEKLEAKLAKAVEGLQHYACSCVIPCEQLNGSCGDVARKALAELTGGRDE